MYNAVGCTPCNSLFLWGATFLSPHPGNKEFSPYHGRIECMTDIQDEYHKIQPRNNDLLSWQMNDDDLEHPSF